MSDRFPSRAGPALPVSKGRVFLRRLCSFVVLWGVVLLGLFWGPDPVPRAVFLVLMTAIAALGLSEFYGMARQRGIACFAGLGLFGGVILVAGTGLIFWRGSGSLAALRQVESFEAGWMVLWILGVCLWQLWAAPNPMGLQAMGSTVLGWIYGAWLLNFIVKIYFYPGAGGPWYLLYFILVTKLSDSGAYGVGSLWGRHKMIPRISPGKTWEGFGGAVLIATAASVIFAWLAGPRLGGMTTSHALILGLVLSVGAVAGDLVESMFKREAGLKDSGRYFPGIGGVLDLMDSLLFNAPLMYLYLRHVLAPAGPAWPVSVLEGHL